MAFISKVKGLKNAEWDDFFNEKVKQIFEKKTKIIDIGGGLRIFKNKGNRYDPKREWIQKYLLQVEYKIMDYTPQYNPDIVGDIHNIPLKNNSVDAIICLAVLEHIENPFKAFSEMYRILKKGGYLLVYVPFLYAYHAHPGYYGDYWRYTEDSIKHLSKDFSSIEIQNVRGRFETQVCLTRFIRNTSINKIARVVDILFKKTNTKQTSGYYVFLVK